MKNQKIILKNNDKMKLKKINKIIKKIIKNLNILKKTNINLKILKKLMILIMKIQNS